MLLFQDNVGEYLVPKDASEDVFYVHRELRKGAVFQGSHASAGVGGGRGLNGNRSSRERRKPAPQVRGSSLGHREVCVSVPPL